MFSNTLIFSTLIASLYAASASADDFSANKPTGLVQCAKTTLSWTGGAGPYDVYVFTGCEDDNEDPIFTATGVTGNSVDWEVTEVSGKGMLFEVVDSTNESVFAEESYIGGDASASAACAAKISEWAASTVSVSSTASVAGPTTMSGASGDGVANAEQGPTFSGSIATATPVAGSSSISGATSLSARPLAFVLGSVALGALALL